MRKCCCCISVHVGAIFLGILGVLLILGELALLIPYLLNMDGFNPIGNNMNSALYQFEDMLKRQNFSQGEADEITDLVENNAWYVLLAEACFAALFGLVSFFMVIGVQCKQRWLMVPYLVLQMFCIVTFLIFCIITCVLLFFISIIMCSIAAVIFFLMAFLMIYFWAAVQKSYVELGNRDYMYSPAPVKPIYNPGDQHRYQPTAPQQFHME